MRRQAARVLAVAAIVLVVAAPPAGAHVTIDPGEAVQGGFAYLNVRVPNEANELGEVQDGARTNRVEFSIPTEDPITVVQVQHTPGWDYELETTPLDDPIEQDEGEPITEVVSKITWTGGAVGPPEFAVFQIVLGPLPEEVDMLMFPTVQTYDSGEAVAWDEQGHDGEFPAPSLALVPPGEEGAMGGMGSATEAQGGGPSVENGATQDDVDGASTLGIVGIVVGLVGVALAGFALLRPRGVPSSSVIAGTTSSPVETT
jgi:uncharacterized protein YcnI